MAKTYFYNQDKGSTLTNLKEKTITSNGVYVAKDEGADGYSKVSVLVEAGGGSYDWNIYQGIAPPEIEDRDALFLETDRPTDSIHLVNSNVELAWVSREYDNLPSNIALGSRGTQIDADIYFVGGTSNGYFNTYLNTVYKYNLITKTVTQLSNYSLAAHNIVAVGSMDKLYCFGGKIPPSGSSSISYCTSTCYCYDIEMDIYTEMARMPPQDPPYAVGACENEEFVFMMGGINWKGTGSAYFGQYNKALNTWTSLPNAPVGVGAGYAEIEAGTIYYTTTTSNWRSDTFAYSFETNTWSSLGLAIYLSGVTLNAKAFKGKLFLISGQSQWSGHLNQVVVYDIATKTASNFPPSLRARTGAMLAVHEGKGYLIGGANPSNSHSIQPLVEETIFDYTNTDKTEDAVTIRADFSLDGLQINEKIKLNNISAYQAAEGVTKKLECKEKRKGEQWV